MYTAIERGDERRPDPSACEVGQTGAPEVAEPDGSSTQIQYNSVGKEIVTIDQLSRQTSYQYDLMGRLPQTTYPVTTTESSTCMPKATASQAPTAAGAPPHSPTTR
jgi:YD repeat-containing protein